MSAMAGQVLPERLINCLSYFTELSNIWLQSSRPSSRARLRQGVGRATCARS